MHITKDAIPLSMQNYKERIFNTKKKHLTIILAAIIGTSLIIPYQIFAQKQGGGGGQDPPLGDVGVSKIPPNMCVAWASNEIVGKSSWYAIMCRPSITGNVKQVVMDFSPDTFDVTGTGLEPIRTLNLQEGNLSGDAASAVLTYTISARDPNPIGARSIFKLTIGHIINPSADSPPLTYTVAVTTKDNKGAVIEAYPPTTPVELEFVDSAEILDKSITGEDIACPFIIDSSTLAVDCVNNRVGIGTTNPTSSLHVVGTFTATGTKASTVKTDSFGERKLYAKESPSVRFHDEGTARLSGGIARVDLDPIFAETIEGTLVVHVTPYGPTNLYVAERGDRHFVVKSLDEEEDIEFGWYVSAFRRGYSDLRLEEVPE